MFPGSFPPDGPPTGDPPASHGRRWPEHPAAAWEIDLQLPTRRVRLRNLSGCRNFGLRPRLAPLAVPRSAPRAAGIGPAGIGPVDIGPVDIGPVGIGPAGIGEPDHRIDIVACDGGFALRIDGAPSAATGNVRRLRAELIAGLLALAHAPRRIAMLVHAAALSVDGAGMLLCAPAGGGKTTLALALARAGATLVSDDTAAVLDADFRLAGLPLALRVRASGWPLAAALLPDGGGLAHRRSGQRFVRPATAGRTAWEIGPAAAVAMLERRPEPGFAVTRLPAAAGLEGMAAAGAGRLAAARDGEDAAGLLARWSASTRFLRLSYGSPADGVEGVHAIRSALP